MSHMVNDPWLGQKKNLDYLLYNVLMCILQFFLTINYFLVFIVKHLCTTPQ